MSFEPGISIPTRERCGVCHRVSPIGFWVPNDLWLRAVPDYFRETVLCLGCFTSFADERMLAWERQMRFYPVSLRSHLEGVVEPASRAAQGETPTDHEAPIYEAIGRYAVPSTGESIAATDARLTEECHRVADRLCPQGWRRLDHYRGDVPDEDAARQGATLRIERLVLVGLMLAAWIQAMRGWSRWSTTPSGRYACRDAGSLHPPNT